MRSSPCILLAAFCVAAFAVPDAASAAGLKADFTIAPGAPKPAEDVTLTSTTASEGTTPVRLTWDLDGDGQFDDGTGQQIVTAYDAGTHQVSLRATQSGRTTEQDVKTRTIVVAEPTPVPTPTATPAPSTTPEPPPASGNQPPTAMIDRRCVSFGSATEPYCEGPLAKVGRAKTFFAGPSSDPDGQIVRHEWDLDGDMTYETDTGGSPQATITYQNTAPVTVRLRVTDDDGATATAAMPLRKLEAACLGTVTFEKIHATSDCFRREVQRTGAVIYRSETPVNLNGIAVTPENGRVVALRLAPVALAGRRQLDVLGRAEASVPVVDQRVVLDRGYLHWRYRGGALRDVELPADTKLNGLTVSGLDGNAIAIPRLAAAEPGLWLVLPSQFGAPSSAEPVKAPVSNPLFRGPVSVASSLRSQARAAAVGAFSFTVPSGSIGPVGLKELTVSYDGIDLWEIRARVAIPEPLNAEIDGAAGIKAGAFNYASVGMTFPGGLGPVGPGIYLNTISFQVEMNPVRGSCIRNVGTENGVDYGVPKLALCGAIGLSAGPQVLGVRALGLDGALGFATFGDGRPAVLRAYGAATLSSVKFAELALEVHTNGYFNASGNFEWGIPGWVRFNGGVGLEMRGSKFNASGHIRACLEFVDLCEGARGLISNKGIVACMDIDLWADTWHPGAGYKWGGPFTPYFSGCEVGPYREQIDRSARASAAGDVERRVQVPAGLPGVVFAAAGAGGAPVITAIGPNGERYTSPREQRAIVTKDSLIVPNAKEKLTQILLPSPAAGTWRIVTEEGSTAVTSLKTANGIEPARVSAKVTGRGHGRVLRYRIEERAGLGVSFSERGGSTGGVIGQARGTRGALRLTPAPGAAESREIVAVVTQDGMLQDEIVVARYRAPAAIKPGRVTRLKITRRGGDVQLGFRKARGAVRHEVVVALSSGRRVVVQTRRASHVVRGVPRDVAVRVAVRGIGRNATLGATTRAALRRR